jgi:hypothetical protein
MDGNVTVYLPPSWRTEQVDAIAIPAFPEDAARITCATPDYMH